MVTHDVAVVGFHPMNETLLQQEIERPVNRGWLGLRLADPELIQQIVGADRARLLGHQAQHFSTLRSQTHTALQAHLFGLNQNLLRRHVCHENSPLDK
jgi:hypothetical protein